MAISLVVAIAFFAMKTYQGHRNIKMVDSYIEQKHLSDDIKSEKTQYSAKKGFITKKLSLKMNLI